MKERIPELVSAGYNDRMIAEELGMSMGWVRKWRGKMGIKSPGDNVPHSNCKTCGVSLLVDGKKSLKGAICMKCHSEQITLRKRNKRDIAVEHLGAKCLDCEGVFPYACYDFHHTDPTQKDDAVGKLINNNHTK